MGLLTSMSEKYIDSVKEENCHGLALHINPNCCYKHEGLGRDYILVTLSNFQGHQINYFLIMFHLCITENLVYSNSS